eukprot:TRINITY_DN4064_c0_g1_i4.p1 TRINITY_DN4064_c0_g1~~TRINITY_DN4064_c0_g1_i4.p1  ORF type:complete len:374 (+),score=92.04 TRINITY_DN4064_c0_g1_i4:57-1124(+)
MAEAAREAELAEFAQLLSAVPRNQWASRLQHFPWPFLRRLAAKYPDFAPAAFEARTAEAEAVRAAHEAEVVRAAQAVRAAYEAEVVRATRETEAVRAAHEAEAEAEAEELEAWQHVLRLLHQDVELQTLFRMLPLHRGRRFTTAAKSVTSEEEAAHFARLVCAQQRAWKSSSFLNVVAEEDVTGQLMNKLVVPFPKLPVRHDELVACLQVPLLAKLPTQWPELVQQLGGLFFFSSFQRVDHNLSYTASAVALGVPKFVGSENNMITSWDHLLLTPLQMAKEHVHQLSSLTFDHKVTDDTTTAIGLKPDRMVFLHGTLVAKGEEKCNASALGAAVSELGSKLKNRRDQAVNVSPTQ